MIPRYLVVLFMCLPFGLSDWSYSQVDDLVLAFNYKTQNDSKTLKKALESIKENNRPYNDTLCYTQFKRIFEGVKNNEKWALKVFDSWGHLPSPGLFFGRTTDFGQFDECLTTAHQFDDEDNIFIGQYCLAQYPLEMIVPIELERQPNAFLNRSRKDDVYARGVCVPDTCSLTALNKIFKQMFYNATKKYIDINMFQEHLCTRHEPSKLRNTDVAALAVLGCVGALILFGTLYDFMANKNEKNPFLISFSIVSNSKKLFSMENKTQSSGSIECLNGIRFISMIWVVFGHLFMVVPYLPTINYTIVWEFVDSKLTGPIVNSSYQVDTFLLLSGFLLVYHTLTIFQKGKTLSLGGILWMYIHRFIRLLPLLAVSVLFTVSLFKYVGDGPYWNILVSKVSRKCDKWWWSSLLYVQNYVNPFELCLTHTWYLSVDTQLYLLSPLVLVPLHKWGRKFVIVLFFILFASISYIFTISMVTEASGRVLETITAAQDKNKPLLYYSVAGRCAPWLVGVILGYLVHTIKRKPTKWRKFGFLLGWISWIPLLGVLMVGNLDAQQVDAVQDTVANSFYAAFSRTAWATLIGWVIFACHQGYGGVINSFLSFPMWQPFARLTYAIYLIHPFIQLTTVGEARINTYGSPSNTIRIFWGDFGIILTVAILVILLFESPIIALEKALLVGNSRGKRSSSENSTVLCEPKDNGKPKIYG